MSEFFRDLFQNSSPSRQLLETALEEGLLERNFIEKEALSYWFAPLLKGSEKKIVINVHSSKIQSEQFLDVVDFLVENNGVGTALIPNSEWSPISLAIRLKHWGLVEKLISKHMPEQDFWDQPLPDKKQQNLGEHLNAYAPKLKNKTSQHAGGLDITQDPSVYTKVQNQKFLVDLILNPDFAFPTNEDGVVFGADFGFKQEWTNDLVFENFNLPARSSNLELLLLLDIAYHKKTLVGFKKSITENHLKVLSDSIENRRFKSNLHSGKSIGLLGLTALRLFKSTNSISEDNYVHAHLLSKVKISKSAWEEELSPGVSVKNVLYMSLVSNTNIPVLKALKMIGRSMHSLSDPDFVAQLELASSWLLKKSKAKSADLKDSLFRYWAIHLWQDVCENKFSVNPESRPEFLVQKTIERLEIDKGGFAINYSKLEFYMDKNVKSFGSNFQKLLEKPLGEEFWVRLCLDETQSYASTVIALKAINRRGIKQDDLLPPPKFLEKVRYFLERYRLAQEDHMNEVKSLFLSIALKDKIEPSKPKPRF